MAAAMLGDVAELLLNDGPDVRRRGPSSWPAAMLSRSARCMGAPSMPRAVATPASTYSDRVLCACTACAPLGTCAWNSAIAGMRNLPRASMVVAPGGADLGPP